MQLVCLLSRCIAIPALFFLTSCTTLFPSRPERDAVAELKRSIDVILDDSVFIPARTGIKIVSLKDGHVLYDRESKALFHPASNLKLLTTATGLHALGTQYKFKTAIYLDSLSSDGTVIGNLYLKGFGNPDLRLTDLEEMIEQLKGIGVKAIQGDIVGDASFFDSLFWGKGWMWDDEPSFYEAFISPLAINDNCVRVKVSPQAKIGEPVRVLLNPQTRFLSVALNGVTGPDSSENTLEVTRDLKERSNTVLVHGSLPRNLGEQEFTISVWQPELYATTLLREELERNGILIVGQPRLGITGEHAKQFVLHEWPIDSVTVNINKVSDNLSAENTLKVIGAEKRGIPGAADKGISVVNEFLFSLGIDTTTYYMVDGSGVSHYNLISAETIVQLLAGMYRENDLFEIFYRSFPIAGVDGTLENRMKGTLAAGTVRAKTGSLSGVSSLSGYAKTEDEDFLAFSILIQHFPGTSTPYRNAQDKIAELLARFNRNVIRSF